MPIPLRADYGAPPRTEVIAVPPPMLPSRPGQED
jgi:hypothetical protein